MIDINWESLKEPDMYDVSLYEKILSVSNMIERSKYKEELFKVARKFKIKTTVEKNFEKFEKEQELKEQAGSVIDFGDNAPIQKMIAPGYYKDKLNNIRIFDKNTLVTATMLQPVAILKNKDTNEELIKCAFLRRNKWEFFIINKETILNNGKITKLANKGVDVTSSSSNLLVNYIRALLNNNEIPEHISTSKMGWYENYFLPYDKSIEFDGEESFKIPFESLHTKGDFSIWMKQISEDRVDNIPLKLVMATSFASPLLHLLHKLPFVTLIWGKSGGGKTVAAKMAMSIWRR